MTETTSRPSPSGHLVTAVLVCHDGALWLPEVLDALASQTRLPDRFIAVDTGSTDDSVAIINATLGDASVISMPFETSFGAAVEAGLDALAGSAVPTAHAGEPTEWIWLLHDDCAPEPAALEELLLRVADTSSIWLVGPKVRGWRDWRLLEAGLTINAIGHIDVGFDGIELDQGQRDDVDEVLALSTACALIRRDIWVRLGGLDPAWSGYGDDVDLGWRINAAGGLVVVAAGAVVRHVRAQIVGRRKTAVRKGPRAVVRRRSGMQVVLTNTSPLLVPLLLVRYLVGGVLRTIGLMALSRRPAQASGELLGVIGVFAHPMVIITGRRDRARSREVPHRELRRLLPSAASRWRSSPFRVGRFGVERVRAQRQTRSAEPGPVSEEAESLVVEESIVARFLRRPTTALFVLMSLVALIAERHVQSEFLHGGRLLPAPNGSSALWSTYLATWHPNFVGSLTSAPPSLGILALLSTIALGKVWLVVDLVILGVVPFAALSAFTAARSLTATVQVRFWVAIVYSLLPAVTGAVAGGRIDVAFVAILLPQVIRAGVAAVNAQSWLTGVRRGIGAGFLLALTAAFAPLLWPFALVALVVGLGFAELDAYQARTGTAPQLDAPQPETTPEAAVAAGSSADTADLEAPVDVPRLLRLVSAALILLVPVIVLVPWSFQVFASPHLVLAGSGLPEFYTSHGAPSGFALALLRAGGPAQPPVWIGVSIVAAALLGLNRQSRVAIARTGAALLVIGVGVAIALTRGAGVTAGLPASRHWPGVALLVAGAGALLAALVAAVGARPALREQSFGWRQPAAVGLVVIAVVSTLTLGVGWALRGAGAPLTSSSPAVLPLFVSSEIADLPSSPRALLLDASGPRVSYALIRRPDGPQLGDADTASRGGASPAQGKLAAAVRDLVAGRPGAGEELAPFDIGYVVAPSASARRVASALGHASTLTVLPAPGATVWRSALPTGELSVLAAPSASQALKGGVPAAPALAVLSASVGSAGSLSAAVPAGDAGRLAVLAEPANRHWRATVNGQPLVARTAYGWAQAFELPVGGGRLRIDFRSDSRREWLWVELAAVVVVLIAMTPGRRPDDEDGLG
ncbi:MAG TPA: glycosyltransferase family 2 protein [Mycobacteriales bacterium]|nr:glycosyltransferase family 2 protein [Mycobacteriales bacterium]